MYVRVLLHAALALIYVCVRNSSSPGRMSVGGSAHPLHFCGSPHADGLHTYALAPSFVLSLCFSLPLPFSPCLSARASLSVYAPAFDPVHVMCAPVYMCLATYHHRFDAARHRHSSGKRLFLEMGCILDVTRQRYNTQPIRPSCCQTVHWCCIRLLRFEAVTFASWEHEELWKAHRSAVVVQNTKYNGDPPQLEWAVRSWEAYATL